MKYTFGFEEIRESFKGDLGELLFIVGDDFGELFFIVGVIEMFFGDLDEVTGDKDFVLINQALITINLLG